MWIIKNGEYVDWQLQTFLPFSHRVTKTSLNPHSGDFLKLKVRGKARASDRVTWVISSTDITDRGLWW